MSDVTRYFTTGTLLSCQATRKLYSHATDYVRASDYDAALSQLAALREELANLKNGFKWESERAALLLDALNDCESSLADAERRNVSLLELLRNPTDEMVAAGNGAAVVEMDHDSELGSCGWISNADEVLEEMLKIALNPKPEAASHDE